MFYIQHSKVTDPHRAMNGSPTISVVTMTKLDQFFAISVHDVLHQTRPNFTLHRIYTIIINITSIFMGSIAMQRSGT